MKTAKVIVCAMVCAMAGVFSAVADEGAVAVEDGASDYFKSIVFVGLYKTDGSTECVLAAGNVYLAEKWKVNIETTTAFPLQFVLITKGGSKRMSLVKSADSKILRDDKKPYSHLNGMTYSEIIRKVARLRMVPDKDNSKGLD